MAASYRFAEGGHFRQWSFVRLCGQGSFGSVFEAEAEGEPHCAVKVINMTNCDAHMRETIRSECQLLSGFNHPNVIAFHRSLSTQDTLYVCVFMELCDMDLKAFIKRQQRALDERDVVVLCNQVLKGLAYLRYEKVVVHRDLKPANIGIVFGDKRQPHTADNMMLKIMDFGHSRVFDEEEMLETVDVGTPYYSCPELLQGDHYSSNLDCWSLGVITYELAYLKRPFEPRRQSLLDLLNLILKNEIAFPQDRAGPDGTVKPPMSIEFVACITDLLRLRPEDRLDLLGIQTSDWFGLWQGVIGAGGGGDDGDDGFVLDLDLSVTGPGGLPSPRPVPGDDNEDDEDGLTGSVVRVDARSQVLVDLHNHLTVHRESDLGSLLAKPLEACRAVLAKAEIQNLDDHVARETQTRIRLTDVSGMIDNSLRRVRASMDDFEEGEDDKISDFFDDTATWLQNHADEVGRLSERLSGAKSRLGSAAEIAAARDSVKRSADSLTSLLAQLDQAFNDGMALFAAHPSLNAASLDDDEFAVFSGVLASYKNLVARLRADDVAIMGESERLKDLARDLRHAVVETRDVDDRIDHIIAMCERLTYSVAVAMVLRNKARAQLASSAPPGTPPAGGPSVLELRALLEEANARNEQLELQVTQLKEGRGTEQARLAALEGKIGTLKEIVATLTAEKHEALDSVASLGSRLQEAESANKELRSELVSATEAGATAGGGVAAVAAMEARLAEQEAIIAELRQARADLAAQIEASQAASSSAGDVGSSPADSASLETRLTEVTGQRDELLVRVTRQADEARTALAARADALREATAEAAALKTRLLALGSQEVEDQRLRLCRMMDMRPQADESLLDSLRMISDELEGKMRAFGQRAQQVEDLQEVLQAAAVATGNPDVVAAQATDQTAVVGAVRVIRAALNDIQSAIIDRNARPEELLAPQDVVGLVIERLVDQGEKIVKYRERAFRLDAKLTDLMAHLENVPNKAAPASELVASVFGWLASYRAPALPRELLSQDTFGVSFGIRAADRPRQESMSLINLPPGPDSPGPSSSSVSGPGLSASTETDATVGGGSAPSSAPLALPGQVPAIDLAQLVGSPPSHDRYVLCVPFENEQGEKANYRAVFFHNIDESGAAAAPPLFVVAAGSGPHTGDDAIYNFIVTRVVWTEEMTATASPTHNPYHLPIGQTYTCFHCTSPVMRGEEE